MDGVSLLMYTSARPTPEHLKILHFLLEKLQVDASQLDAKHRDALFFAISNNFFSVMTSVYTLRFTQLADKIWCIFKYISQ